MLFRQFYLGCLAHASYLVGDGDEAAVVDPQRDVEQYLEAAREAGMRIRWVIETHLHADFVSGHRELAERTGAEILIGQRARATFPHRPITDRLTLAIGQLRLRFLETPGHTPEGISILVEPPAGPLKLLTGDTLFIGDVGRPDLVTSKGHTAAEMAGMLYDSLHQQILPLPDATEIWPAHGAGSACGRFMSDERSSTLGMQRRTNYALAPMSKDAFIRLVAEDLPPPPRYFPRDAEQNRQGAAPLDELPRPAALEPAAFAARQAAGATVLDVRDASAYGRGHVPGSVQIGLSGQFAPWAGSLLASDKPILLVADDDEAAAEARVRLARVGLDRVEGTLAGGLAAWDRAGRPVAQLAQTTVSELAARLAAGDPPHILDVRRPAEHAAAHVPGALNVPLDRLADAALPTDDRPLYVICAGGYRSSVACSLLLGHQVPNLVNVLGGTSAWVEAGYTTEKSQ
jgi:hydroxyacylglutathione hydrolase